MLRFLVGTAVRTAARTATRAAINSHREERARQEAAAQWAQQMAGRFALTPNATGETALYEDRRVGFSHAIPGYPRALQSTPSPIEPAVDTLIGLGDIPVTLRYRVDQPQLQAASAVDYAVRAAQTYVVGRTRVQHPVSPARADQVASWAVEAAAVARYPLPQPDAFGADFEELYVLVRQAVAMVVTVRYPSQQMDWLRQALFTTAMQGSFLWDPQRFRYAPTIWPQSAFLEPGLDASLTPHKCEVLQQITPTLGALATAEKEALSSVLGALVGREEPPWASVAPEALGAHAQSLVACSAEPRYQAIVRQAAGEVRTAHDLRGLAVLLGRAMNGPSPA
jgi:hypothetical protein